MSTLESDIILNNVTKVFRVGFGKKRTAVDNLSIGVPRGRVVGLLGPNGSGKSTTLKMILGFLKPTQGEILICGQSVESRQTRNFIGYLPENPRFQRFLSGIEALRYFASLLGLSGSLREKRCEELLELVGLGHAARERVRGYSKGMIQRLAIAQAILNRPQLVILDEPMSGLDPLGRMEMRTLIADIHREMPQSTIFFSSHVLEDIEQLCSTVALLQKGKLKAFCDINELLRQESQRFDITVDKLPDTLRTKLFKDQHGLETSLGITFAADGINELKDDLDELSRAGVKIFNVNMHRRKLEEALFRENELLLPMTLSIPPQEKNT